MEGDQSQNDVIRCHPAQILPPSSPFLTSVSWLDGIIHAAALKAIEWFHLNPEAQSFQTMEDYYSVLFHELTHSTGHDSRLNRKGVSGTDGAWSAFGSAPYAREELVAEMGSAFLCGQAGIVERTIENSASYISSWVAKLKEDKKLVVHAAAQAQRAADFILGKLPTIPGDTEE